VCKATRRAKLVDLVSFTRTHVLPGGDGWCARCSVRRPYRPIILIMVSIPLLLYCRTPKPLSSLHPLHFRRSDGVCKEF